MLLVFRLFLWWTHTKILVKISYLLQCLEKRFYIQQKLYIQRISLYSKKKKKTYIRNFVMFRESFLFQRNFYIWRNFFHGNFSYSERKLYLNKTLIFGEKIFIFKKNLSEAAIFVGVLQIFTRWHHMHLFFF